MTLLSHLKERGLVQDCTDFVELEKLLESQKLAFYCGFDATAESLQAGNLIPIIVMRWLQRAGHLPICLLGSVTSMIGDPSGKSDERKLLDQETVDRNVNAIDQQMKLLLSSEAGAQFELVKNGDWLSSITMVEFLRDVGKHLTVNFMLAKDSVKGRLENREQGISYTEFSYMLLQAYDFLWLAQNKGCRLQIGGSDQWGNITAGTELIRKKLGPDQPQCYGLTMPLLLTSAGTKFGKTEQGTIWLDGNRTSPYQFYQFWLNTPDADAIRYLKIFTFLPLEEIGELEENLKQTPEARFPQKRLAEEMVTLVHGADEVERARRASAVLFGGDLDGIAPETLEEIFSDVPSITIPRSEFATQIATGDLLVRCGAAESKSAARRAIEGGGIYLNNQRITLERASVGSVDLIGGCLLVVRSGKRKYWLIRAND